MTSMNDDGAKQKARDEGVSEVLTKPVKSSMLFNVIVNLTAKEDAESKRPVAKLARE